MVDHSGDLGGGTSVKLQIALLVGRFVPTLGGLESWAYDLAVALVARGHGVSILTTEASVCPAGATIHLVPTSSRTIEQAKLFATAAQGFADHIIHDTGVALGADVYQPQMGCRVLNLRRDDEAQRPTERLRRLVSRSHKRWKRAIAKLEKTQLRNSQSIVAVSLEAAAAFRDRYAIPDSRIYLIPNGIDTSAFHPDHCQKLRQPTRESLDIPPTTLVLFTAAGNFRLKGVQHAIAALAMIGTQRPDLLLLVAGAGDIADFAALARQYRVADRVRFLGHCPDMVRLFAAADIFVHLTAHDACSLATLEAMACGLPVITTSRNGAADGITPGRAGFVLDVPDAAATAKLVLRLVGDDERVTIGKAARALAEQHDFAATVDQIEMLYAELGKSAAFKVG